MSGHSRWAGIKHKKGMLDAKRGKLWTKIVREIAIAAKISGGHPESNPRLRKAMDDAREANMPAENIKKAIQRGTGELPGVNYEEMVYEGYGPHGVALIVEVTTDNKNRTAGEIRRVFSLRGGNLGDRVSRLDIFLQGADCHRKIKNHRRPAHDRCSGCGRGRYQFGGQRGV